MKQQPNYKGYRLIEKHNYCIHYCPVKVDK